MNQDEIFMKKTIELSEAAVAHGNEPFGAVLVKDGEKRSDIPCGDRADPTI